MSEELVQINNEPEYFEPSYSDPLADVRIKPSEVAIIQPSTVNKMGGQIGQLLNKDEGVVSEKIAVVILDITEQRTKFPPGNDLGSPLCKSFDGIKPAPRSIVPDPVWHECRTCPDSQWVKLPNGKNKKPPCGEAIRFLMVDKNTMLPFYFTARGSSVPVAKNLRERLKKLAASHGAKAAVELRTETDPEKIASLKRFTKLRIYDFNLILTTEPNPQNPVFPLMRYEKESVMPDSSVFAEMYDMYVAARQRERKAQQIAESAQSTVKQIEGVLEAEPVEV